MKPDLIFDCETNGLLDQMDRVHLLCIGGRGTRKRMMFRRNDSCDNIAEGLRILMNATLEGRFIYGHNVIKFDVPAIQKVYPWFKPDMRYVRDTLVMARLVWPDLMDSDGSLVESGRLPKHLRGRYSLESFGYRLGNYKGDYTGKWDEWNQDMEDYCDQDVAVTADLLERLLSRGFSEESINLEHQVQRILLRQELHGFRFDHEKARILLVDLNRKKLAVESELLSIFGSRWFPDGAVTTPRLDRREQCDWLGMDFNNPITKGRGKDKVITGYKFKTMDWVAGAPHQKVKLVQFNPSSRQHIYLWLRDRYGWEPAEFTPSGEAKVDETTLDGLEYPEARKLKEYLLLTKRIAQLSEGSEAWLRNVQEDGRIHGRVTTNGAVTGRMTHQKPNMAQVPASKSPYGHECRELFTVAPGYLLVGCDASALELCDLAGYMAKYDGGEYVKVVLEGDKSVGTDIHSVNARALGLDPKGTYFDGESGRDIAKTWFYAFIYGAGDHQLGFVLTRRKDPEVPQRGRGGVIRMVRKGPVSKRGKKSRQDFMENLPALGKLVDKVKATAKDRGYLVGLDGRHLNVRSAHAALNTLLQSAGAVQMKKALCILDDELQNIHGFMPGVDYEFVANVHDEWQIEAREEIASFVGEVAAQAIRKAGEHFQFRCPLSGEYRVGRNWAETH